jgi:two-component sensor histidine kinase
MPGYSLLYLVSLITFTFGALSFSVLTLFYWRERRRHRWSGGGAVFPAFTLVCAAAFLINLVLQIAAAIRSDSPWITGLTLALALVTGLLPPLLFHLIAVEEEPWLPARSEWRWLQFGFYALNVAVAFAQGLDDSELVTTGWSDVLDNLRPLLFGAAASMGLLAQVLSRRTLTTIEHRNRLWNRVLLCLALFCAAANVAKAGPFVALVPDYVLLGFFCVTLYYQERLVFFDLLIKRGAFFALALVGLTAIFTAGPGIYARLPSDWSRPWMCALMLMPFWLAAPWIYNHLSHLIDRAWLRRIYSPEEAEREFVRDVQAAATEEALLARAIASLSRIFQTVAEIQFRPDTEPLASDLNNALLGGEPISDVGQPFLAAADFSRPNFRSTLEHQGVALGWIALNPRPNGIPFLSDDRRLLQSVARTLSVVLENVRFRQREQQLRWLSSRAELKALRAQINPHFLFNALNAIAGLIPSQPALADETVEQLAEVFRYTLRKSDNEWVRLSEEIAFVESYLRVEKARFGERLEVTFDVDAAAAAVRIPAMTIQPIVENAIKHGASVREGRGTVLLRVSVSSDALLVAVTDNGPGFPPDFSLASHSNGAGHGLRNVAERLQGYYGTRAKLRWESGPDGTLVVLEIPQVPDPESSRTQ